MLWLLWLLLLLLNLRATTRDMARARSRFLLCGPDDPGDPGDPGLSPFQI